MMDWSCETTKTGEPMAVLRAKREIVAKIYLSPDGVTLRIVLPELSLLSQLKINVEGKLIDFKRES